MVSHTLLSHPAEIIVNIKDTVINKVNDTIFLGVNLDNTLKLKSHIDSIKTKLSKLTGILYRIREYLFFFFFFLRLSP